MSGGDEAADKPHEASPRKLDEARRRGELPRTADLTATAAMAGFAALALLPGGWAPERLALLGRGLLDGADGWAAALFGGGVAPAGAILGALGAALAPVALIPAALVLALLVALRGLVLAPARLEPKVSRLSPIANARQKFGPSGLFEFGKSALKLLVYGTVLALFLTARLPRLMTAIGQSPGQATALMLELTVQFLLLIVVIMAVLGTADHLFQVFDHRRRQRMTDHELRDELKSAEGDPHLKQARRSRGQSIATNRMLADVPRASVVIVNPAHYAVALRWAPGSAGAPVCVAKGVDEVAAAIRARAAAAGVPIRADPPTARALHATVRIGDEVSPDHYAPVAAAIRFAEAMRLKARARHGAARPGGGG